MKSKIKFEFRGGRACCSIVGALCYDDHKGANNQAVGDGKVVVEMYKQDSSIKGITPPLDAHYYLGCGARGGVEREFVVTEEKTMEVVRRLTEVECERLQAFPDNWTMIPDTVVNGKVVKCSSSARYKALGNSIALPQWWHLICRMNLPMGSTLGSLFSGIGGFDLVWETRYGIGTSRWTSEIEPFPIAVLINRFGDEERGIEGNAEDFIKRY